MTEMEKYRWREIEHERKRASETERVGTLCCGVGSGRPVQSRERSVAQISSEADSSLTGIRGLPVNNRGSDLGHLAP